MFITAFSVPAEKGHKGGTDQIKIEQNSLKWILMLILLSRTVAFLSRSKNAVTIYFTAF